MYRRYTWAYAMILVVNTVSAQKKAEGFTQGEALLPCNYDDVAVKAINIFWRDKDDKNVYDVLNGQADVSSQFSLYRNRVSGFPLEYSKGNFSLQLKDLKVTDSGRYTCFIPEVNILRQVDLTVKESRSPNGQTDIRDGSGVKEQSLYFLLPLLHMLLPN